MVGVVKGGNIKKHLFGFFKFLLIFLMIQIKEYNAIIRELFASIAFLLEPLIFLTAKAAPVIDEPIIPAPHILFKPAVIQPLHFPICIGGVVE